MGRATQFKIRGAAGLVAIVAALLLSAQTALAQIDWNTNPNANGYTIAEIIDQGGLRVGDKLFTNFDVVSTPGRTNPSSTGPLPGAPNASSIRVRGFFDSNGDIGLEFNGAWFANVGQVVNTNITFVVTPDAPFEIEGVGLQLAAFGALGDGAVNIAENVFEAPSVFPPLANLLVNYQKNGPFNIFQDFGSFVPQDSIFVSKDIIVTSGGNGIAHLSRFTQTFRQIPEPASVALLLGGIALIARRRRSA